ncbi:MAG: Sodium-dependent phosphate transporter [Burkholderiaceae bacterium]|jgi:phosphate:Na+ symporter|nr:MAG: Sodium-dependent phosphate transporter [Burkholderiaceae bacterium]
MKHLLNLLAAVALLVWGTQLVRSGVLRAFGSHLRQFLAYSLRNRFTAALSGIGVTALLQSSTATSLMTASFVGEGLIRLPAALAVMRGADVGTALMVVLFSFDLSWLSPLFIFIGVVLYLTRQDTVVGRVGRVLIGLGLILLALQLIMGAAEPLLATPAVRALLDSVGSDLTTEIILGMVLAVLAYSSLAVVLLISALAASTMISMEVALGLVLGANLGSGVAAVLTTSKSAIEVRQVTVGNLMFKIMGVALMSPCIGLWLRYVQPHLPGPTHGVVLFHLGFNLIVSVLFIGLTYPVARLVARFMPRPPETAATSMRPRHLDRSALATPSLALSCAVREALHQADVVETMLTGMLTVIKTDDLRLARELRRMDDTVDQLYSAIKYYMTKIPREALDEEESRRWTDVISFTINMEQIGDIVERVILDVEDKKIKQGFAFSEAGMADLCTMHARLVDNLRLGMSVFLNGNLHDAKKLIEEKMRFRELEMRAGAAHLDRLSENSVLSMETSSLHIDLISDFKRINSHICSIAYPILDSAGALAPNRLRPTEAADEAHHEA